MRCKPEQLVTRLSRFERIMEKFVRETMDFFKCDSRDEAIKVIELWIEGYHDAPPEGYGEIVWHKHSDKWEEHSPRLSEIRLKS